MKYVFGPVPSRRFGRSLGVNVVPLKVCNWNCVYCQLGRTTTFINEERDFFDKEEIKKEIEKAVKIFDYDYLTFIGDGEPTLYSKLGELVRWSKKIQDKKVAVFTNGGRLYLDKVRKDLSPADVVKVSTDAGDERTFRIVDRPHREITFPKFLEGLQKFREEFSGEIWAEVMLVKGINDKEDELEKIGEALASFSPDKVHIMVPTRPPAEKWALPPSAESLIKAGKIISKYVREVYIIDYVERGKFYVDPKNPLESVLLTLKIQPMTEDEIREVCKEHNIDLKEVMKVAKEVEFNGIKYFVY